MENELCPVFTARLRSGERADPRPEEIDSLTWVDARSLIDVVDAAPFAFSPWMIAQLADARLWDALLR